MKNHIIPVVLCCMAGVAPFTADAQTAGEKNIAASIIGADGKSVAETVIPAMEGRISTKLPQTSGKSPQSPTEHDPAPATPNGAIQSKKTVYLADSSDQVSVPFDVLSKRRITGAVAVIRMNDFKEAYTDRNYWTLVRAGAMGLFSATDVRGTGSVIIIDGLVRDGNSAVVSFSDMITSSEIEEVTVLKDAASRILYGSLADAGIIMIKTRRGEAYKPRMNFMYESAFGVPISYPNYLKAADYMILYNEARKNDGLLPIYSWEDIENTRNSIDPVKYPDVDYYRGNEFLARVKPQQRIQAEFTGGNSAAQYYLNLGYLNSNSLLKEGEGADQSTNRFNVHGAMDVKINEYIKTTLDGTAIFNAYHGPNYQSVNFWNLSTSQRVNAYPLLIPINRIREEDIGLVEEAARQRSIIKENYLLGGDRNFMQNLLGDFNLGGYDNTMDRLMNVNIGVDVNLKQIADGLSFKTYFGSDNYNQYAIRQINRYAVYNPVEQNDGMLAVEKIGDNDFVGEQTMNNIAFYRRYGWINTLNYNRILASKHDINAVLISHLNTYKQSGFINTERHANFGLRANYLYDNRLIAEYSSAYIGSPYFKDGRRWGYAQSVGAGWILSEEKFTANLPFPDYLKLKVTWANTKSYHHSSFNSFHLFENTYTAGSVYNYGNGTGANNAVTVNYGNDNISWVQRSEFNAGVETAIFNRTVFVEMNYFNSLHYGIPERPVNTYPEYFGGGNFIPVENYGRQHEQGFEAGVNFSHKSGEWQLNAGINMIYIAPRILTTDELLYPPEEQYLSKKGTSPFAQWGLIAEGLYTQEEIDRINHPDEDAVRPTFGTVRAGDIKYRDLNSDKKIDSEDVTVIGSSHATAGYGLTVGAAWRNLTLWAYFAAQRGKSGFFRGNYYNVTGEMKYPAHLTGRWAYDPETGVDTRSTATYPRLTTAEEANNFRNSTWWLGTHNSVSMPALQLGYSFDRKITGALRMKKLTVFVRGQNLFMIGPNAAKLQLNVGSEPQMRWYYAGLNAEF
ncbi:MAG: SusC/RagA family TonB-linked outer membrane protein [Tannerella sp.]|nr:SusC/RagA family TonB-linked outer membrane protein [Tannerella sp.]